MVLGYGGFLGLSTTQYHEKLRNATLEDLKKQEVVKIRAQFACAWSIASGIGWAYFTFGGSLVVCGIGGRKWRVADRKLGMIRTELTSRGVPLHKLNWKDVVIPLTACAAGTAAGAGIDVGIGSLVNIGDVITSGSGNTLATTSGSHSEELQAMFSHPAHAVQGFGEGALVQPDVVAHGGTVSVADLLGIAPTDVPVQTVDFNALDINNRLAEFGGAQLGANASTSLERAAGQLVTQELSWWIGESFEDSKSWQEATKHLGCRRYLGTQGLECNGCRSQIDRGTYWHCCDCDEDDFDLCNHCFDQGIRCSCQSSNLHRLQFALPGNIYRRSRHAAFERFEKYENLKCKRCPAKITQNRYFECLQCDRSGAGLAICLQCYKGGRVCNSAQDHALFSFTWAHAPPPDSAHPYRFSGGCQCNRCHQNVHHGVFFHCQECKGPNGQKGHFDLCRVCYETSGGCRDKNHVLLRFNAFAQSVSFQSSLTENAHCDVPDCHKPLHREGVWYKCRACKVNDGKQVRPFVVCHSCYGSGASCLNRGHNMTQVLCQNALSIR